MHLRLGRPAGDQADVGRLPVDFTDFSVWYSLFSVPRLPVKVEEADCVARVFMRSSIFEMLLRPPSMICSWLMPSLALRTPWVSSAVSLRNLLATASPAASSPDELMR